jgi:hypothetical protein
VKYLISLIPYLTAANLLSHIPKAKPEYSFGSTPAISNTRGCIIPAPNISIHFDIVFSHVFGFVISYLASISKPGSTNGKYHGLILVSTSLFSIAESNFSIICFACAIVIPLSTTIHSSW